jgi:hypothetical protein
MGKASDECIAGLLLDRAEDEIVTESWRSLLDLNLLLASQIFSRVTEVCDRISTGGGTPAPHSAASVELHFPAGSCAMTEVGWSVAQTEMACLQHARPPNVAIGLKWS